MIPWNDREYFTFLKPTLTFLNFIYQKSIKENTVTYEDGVSEDFDCIILSTGYKIDLNFLNENLRKQIFKDKDETILEVILLFYLY